MSIYIMTSDYNITKINSPKLSKPCRPARSLKAARSVLTHLYALFLNGNGISMSRASFQ